MRQAQLQAPAKINLYLEVLGQRADGFHDLSLVFQRIALADAINLRECGGTETSVMYTNRDYHFAQQDICWRAVELLRPLAPQMPGIAIEIEKHIPVGGGLGGSSSNAASILRQLAEWYAIDPTSLPALALALGSDVPFFLSAPCAYATGRGEELTALAPRSVSGCYLLCFETGLETAAVFRALCDQERGPRQDHALEQWRANTEATALDTLCHNRLTAAARRLHPGLDALFERAAQDGIAVHMSGSGSCCYSFDNRVGEWLADDPEIRVQWVEFCR